MEKTTVKLSLNFVDEVYHEAGQRQILCKVKLYELVDIVTCYAIGDFTLMHNTDIYKNRGTSYCQLLEVIEYVLDGRTLVANSPEKIKEHGLITPRIESNKF